MSQTRDRVRWTSADLDLLPDNGNCYEIIDGELFVTCAPHWKHQKAIGKVHRLLDQWSETTGLGETVAAPGVIFSDADNVIPNVVWVSNERLASGLDDAGHLTLAPDLVIELLSSRAENERRENLRYGKAEREVKLKLYLVQGVQEYWIINWQLQQVEIYRRQQALLHRVATLLATDELTSPLLPDFACPVSRLFT